MFDLSICFGDMKAELHQVCLQGYEKYRPLPENHERLIEGFFLGSIVGTFSFRVANPVYTRNSNAKSSANYPRLCDKI